MWSAEYVLTFLLKILNVTTSHKSKEVPLKFTGDLLYYGLVRFTKTEEAIETKLNITHLFILYKTKPNFKSQR